MADPIRVSGPISGTERTLSFETGKLAPQSQGAVLATIGATRVLTTANAASDVRPGIDFFPLTVDVEERSYAAGKIPGSFFRREGRPTEDAILTCRLTDRPLRPSFPDGFRNETQVVTTVLGADQHNPHDVLSINAASAALMISGIPFDGPIGAVRIAYSTDGTWIPHPTFEEGNAATFELVVAGRELDNGDVAVMMVEAGGTEKSFAYYAEGAPKVDEAVLADGLEACKVWIKESIALQRQLVASVIATQGPIERMEFTTAVDYTPEVMAAVEGVVSRRPRRGDQDRRQARAQRRHRCRRRQGARRALCGEGSEFEGQERAVKDAVRSLTKKLVRRRIVDEGKRIDGRGLRDLRPVSAEVGVLPTAHGSGLFQRGETQVMNVCTLAMPRMNQMLDTLSPITEKRFMHHYNMPPWANGETGRVGSPKRREIGHGALAGRAILPVIPSQEDFAYTLRLVSEVLASNGSTSMGSVCASSLALMDAGVPMKGAVAGIAMGLVKDGDNYVTLTDILGAEDAFGDMDFKVAGTADAITALQLDTKIDGIPASVLIAALEQAKEARLQILEVMNAAIAGVARHGRRDGTQDHDDLHPDGQDRRGHRPQGQGHQHHPAGDRRRHQRRRRRRPGHRHDRRRRGLADGRGQGRDPGDRRSAQGRDRQDLHGSRRQHHQVRCVRQHPPRPRRPGAHLQARPRQAHQRCRGRAQPRRRDRGHGRGDRRPRQGQPRARRRPDPRASRQRCAQRRPSQVATAVDRSSGNVETVSFEASFDAELANEFGDLGPASERPRDDDDRGGRNDRGGATTAGGRDRGGRRHR